MAEVLRAKAPVSVTLLTGYLGAGKTTLLNAILDFAEQSERFAFQAVHMLSDGGLIGPRHNPLIR